MAQTKLTNLQIEVLKMMSFATSEEQILLLKDQLFKFFGNLTSELAGEEWLKRGYNNAMMEEWLT